MKRGGPGRDRPWKWDTTATVMPQGNVTATATPTTRGEKPGMMNETLNADGMVWCWIACDWVLPCSCGPHAECPEHYVNCVIDWEEPHAN
jgi:hypothetical protein